MYFKLDAIQARLEEWIKNSYKTGRWSPNATINTEGEIVDARVKGGLRPTPVTRDLAWGVPIPPLGREDDSEMNGKVLCESFSIVRSQGYLRSYQDVWVSIR